MDTPPDTGMSAFFEGHVGSEDMDDALVFILWQIDTTACSLQWRRQELLILGTSDSLGVPLLSLPTRPVLLTGSASSAEPSEGWLLLSL